METIKHEPRVNSGGDPCPPWCVTDHAKYDFHGSERITVYAPQFHSCHIRAIHYGYPAARPEIEVAAGATLPVRAGDAGRLADIIEQLADATPDQHRELAAAIRQAAAVIGDGAR